jgi:hypothetical protein
MRSEQIMISRKNLWHSPPFPPHQRNNNTKQHLDRGVQNKCGRLSKCTCGEQRETGKSVFLLCSARIVVVVIITRAQSAAQEQKCVWPCAPNIPRVDVAGQLPASRKIIVLLWCLYLFLSLSLSRPYVHPLTRLIYISSLAFVYVLCAAARFACESASRRLGK